MKLPCNIYLHWVFHSFALFIIIFYVILLICSLKQVLTFNVKNTSHNYVWSCSMENTWLQHLKVTMFSKPRLSVIKHYYDRLANRLFQNTWIFSISILVPKPLFILFRCFFSKEYKIYCIFQLHCTCEKAYFSEMPI